jgi:putative aldouronate transport system permease protein
MALNIGKRFTAFDAINYLLLALLSLATLYPFWYLLVVSISSKEGYYADPYHLVPKTFSLDSYAVAFQDPRFLRSFLVTIVVTLSGVAIGMFLTSMGGFVLSKRVLKGRRLLFNLILFTMFFDGGLVPYYILVTRILHLRNTLAAFFVPTAINAYFLILMKNYFLTIPDSIEESARIDGASEFRTFWQIVIPISAPIFFTITLFYAVHYWNDFFQALLFANNPKQYPVALFLRDRISSASNFDSYVPDSRVSSPEKDVSTVLLLTILPIVVVYPFVQRYFVQGIMLGSIKE